MASAGGFQHGRNETLGANTGTSVGTAVTASATANAKGSWTSLGTTTFSWEWLNIVMAQTAASDKIIDIGVSADGSNWWVLAQDIRFAGRKSADLLQSIALPLRVSSGVQVGVRVAASTGSHVVECTITGSSAALKGSPAYSRAVALYTAATSRGVAIDPGGSANTKGAWTELVASTATPVDAIYIMIGQNADTTRTLAANALVDIGIGSSSNEYAQIPNLSLRWTTTLDGPQINIGPVPCAIAAGSRVVARAQCSDTTAGDRTLDLGLLGFVP